MKMTLLEMVQDILSIGDGDVVNSVSDTEEAEQVSLIIRDTYFQLLQWEGVPELSNAFLTCKG